MNKHSVAKVLNINVKTVYEYKIKLFKNIVMDDIKWSDVITYICNDIGKDIKSELNSSTAHQLCKKYGWSLTVFNLVARKNNLGRIGIYTTGRKIYSEMDEQILVKEMSLRRKIEADKPKLKKEVVAIPIDNKKASIYVRNGNDVNFRGISTLEECKKYNIEMIGGTIG